MTFYKDVIYQINPDDKEQGCSLISKNYVDVNQDEMVYAKGGGGGGGIQPVTQTTTPWPPQAGHLVNIMDLAGQGYANVPEPFAPFAPQTEEALKRTEARALGGSPLDKAMQQQLLSTLHGDYLAPRNYEDALNASLRAASRQVLPHIRSQFAKGGRYGSAHLRRAETEALGDVYARMQHAYAQLEQQRQLQERANQLRSMLFAPQAAAQDYQDIARLAAVGAQREGLEQRKKDAPQERLRRYATFVGLPHGSVTTGGTPMYGGSRAAGLLGGALGGASLAQMIGGAAGGPIGLGVGAGLGGLLGGFL